MSISVLLNVPKPNNHSGAPAAGRAAGRSSISIEDGNNKTKGINTI